jgi:hypothetical protein
MHEPNLIILITFKVQAHVSNLRVLGADSANMVNNTQTNILKISF